MKQLRSALTDLSVKIGSVTFQNPVFVASGTFGYGLEASGLMDQSRLGAIVTKSITLHPREGNPPPRIVETDSGMLNSIGLANVGVEKYITDFLPRFSTLKANIITNIAGWTEVEYVEVLNKLESVSSVITGYEINISCPNVKKGGMEFGVDPATAERLTATLRRNTEKLLIMKLSPNVTDIGQIARAVENGGADAISAINTVVGMSVNPLTRKPNIHTTYGGLSGPAIKPIGLAMVHKIHQAVRIPIIGIGGIVSGLDAVEYLLAGATAIQVGTANFRTPDAAVKILEEIEDYVREQNIANVSSLTGQLQSYEK
ncbi:MAG: dihydroorotate dehydrogenase [Fidelibacterota bacterium]